MFKIIKWVISKIEGIMKKLNNDIKKDIEAHNNEMSQIKNDSDSFSKYIEEKNKEVDLVFDIEMKKIKEKKAKLDEIDKILEEDNSNE